MTNFGPRTDELQPHAFDECRHAHLADRGPHCFICDRGPDDDIHKIADVAPKEAAA